VSADGYKDRGNEGGGGDTLEVEVSMNDKWFDGFMWL
jgi:hypothetical protein